MNKLKRFLIMGAAVIMMAVSLSGCEKRVVDHSENMENPVGRFQEVYFQSHGGEYTTIYVDVETKVMYMFVKEGYGGGLTVMVDEDGNPLLWEDESDE